MLESNNVIRKKLSELGDMWTKKKNDGIKVVMLLFLVASLFAQIFPPLQALILSQK